MIIKFFKKNNFPRLSIAGILFSVWIPSFVCGQQSAGDTVLTTATLENVIQYALKHQPLVQQSLIDERITETTIRGKLADWYPQVNFFYSYQRNVQLQTLVTGLGTFKSGTVNTSAPQVYATQNIF